MDQEEYRRRLRYQAMQDDWERRRREHWRRIRMYLAVILMGVMMILLIIGSGGLSRSGGMPRTRAEARAAAPSVRNTPARAACAGTERSGYAPPVTPDVVSAEGMSVETVSVDVVPVGTISSESVPPGAVRGTGGRGCGAALTWPVAAPRVSRPFDGPEQPWLPGHRGVDLAIRDGGELLAPADGMVVFAGTVGGKSVVSVRHGRVTSTLEPAASTLAVGSRVRRGAPIARVAGHSDHCDGSCVHWGVKRGEREYADPAELASRRRIALKPVADDGG